MARWYVAAIPVAGCRLPGRKRGKRDRCGYYRTAYQGQTGVIKGFNSKEGKPFSAAVAFDGDFNTVFVFPDVKNNRNSKRKKK